MIVIHFWSGKANAEPLLLIFFEHFLLAFFAYDIERSFDGFFVNIGDIERDKSDGHKHNANEEDDKNRQVL